MGIVFLARDVALDRPVAIKLLPPSFAAVPDLRERFHREARTAAQLSHPNIVPIYLVEERDDLVYFVMAFVDGESLGQRVHRTGPLAPSVVTKIVQEVAWALAYAHKHGVVHRDIKPDNILLEKGSGRALVSDFGIARVTEGGTMTGKGELIGTVRYMSPEQSTGDAVDGRSDIYSLGVTAFYALTGRLPFDGPNLPAIIYKQVSEPPPRIGALAPGIPPRLAEAVERCLAKDPAERYPSGETLAEAVGAAGVRAEVPAAVRALLRVIREAGVTWGVLGAFLYVGFRLADQADPDTRVLILAFVAIFLVLPLGRLISTARKSIRGGLGYADIRRALLADGRAKREEALVLEGEAAVERRLKRRRSSRTLAKGMVWAGGGLVGLALLSGEPLSEVFGPTALTFMGVAGLVHSRDPDSPRGWLSVLDRLLAGRLGKWLFRVAGLGIATPPVSTALEPDRTELVLGGAADQLYKDLPSAVRQRLTEVPAVIAHLQAHLGRLRDREAALSRAIAGVGAPRAERAPTGRREELAAELHDVRAAVQQQLTDAIAALENIRLGLLRLHAGVGSTENVTEDLAKAKDIGEAIDAELAARAEVHDLLEASS